MASFLNTLFGTPQQTKQIPLLSPQQLQTTQAARQAGLAGLQQNPLSFDPIEKRATKQFEEQIIPTLAERFTSMGGGQRSSAFKGALGNVGQDFGERLAALRSQYGLNANKLALQQLQLGLRPEYARQEVPAQEGTFGNIAKIGGSALGSIFGGPVGGAIGNQLGSGLSSLFQNINAPNEEESQNDPLALLQQLFGSLNLPQSKIQQIMNILGAA